MNSAEQCYNSQSQSQSQHAELLLQHPLPSVQTDNNGNSIDNTSATVSTNSSTPTTPTTHSARKRSSMDIISTTVEKIANKEDNDKSAIKQILAVMAAGQQQAQIQAQRSEDRHQEQMNMMMQMIFQMNNNNNGITRTEYLLLRSEHRANLI